jgi:hypothetical protein
MEETTQQKNEIKKRGIILPWSLFTASLLLNIFLYLKYKNEVSQTTAQTEIIKTVYVERDNIKNDLVKLKDEYASLQTNDAKLQAEIDEKRTQIEKLLKEAEKHKNDAYYISKLKKETETLREIMKGYVRTIDSLNVLNQKLIVEKNSISTELNKEKDKSSQLNKDKQSLQATIEKGSVLTCFNISASAINVKSGGKKQVTTSKAKRTDKIKVSFSLGENKIARNGSKDVFVRILTPDGKEMAKSYDDNYRFIFNNSAGYYAGKTNINYNNSEIGVVTVCEGSEPFLPGKYLIEITTDGVVIGQSSLTLD